MKHKFHYLCALVVLAFSFGQSHAALATYQVDENTLSLYIFNEPNEQLLADDEASSERMNLFPAVIDPEYGFGFPSHEALGTGFLAGKSILRNPRYNALMMQGSNGAFTYEAVIRVDHLDPLPSGVTGRTILGWGQGSNAGQIRLNISPEGTVRVQFYNGALNLGGNVNVNPGVPVTGPHAFEVGKYYHVAFTYDGNAGVPGNVRFYWTALDSGAIEAAPLPLFGPSGLSADHPVGEDQNFDFQNNTWLVIGGNLGGDNLQFPGLIDNVRISSVARQPNDFIFVDDGSGPPAPGPAWQLAAAEPREGSIWYTHPWWVDFYPVTDNWMLTEEYGWVYADDHFYGGGWVYWYLAESGEWLLSRNFTHPWVWSFNSGQWVNAEIIHTR